MANIFDIQRAINALLKANTRAEKIRLLRKLIDTIQKALGMKRRDAIKRGRQLLKGKLLEPGLFKDAFPGVLKEIKRSRKARAKRWWWPGARRRRGQAAIRKLKKKKGLGLGGSYDFGMNGYYGIGAVSGPPGYYALGQGDGWDDDDFFDYSDEELDELFGPEPKEEESSWFDDFGEGLSTIVKTAAPIAQAGLQYHIQKEQLDELKKQRKQAAQRPSRPSYGARRPSYGRPASGTPGWVVPVAVGGGLLMVGLIAVVALKK